MSAESGQLYSPLTTDATTDVGVCIVTVTYGDRSSLLKGVLDAVNELQGKTFVRSIVVVDNGACENTKKFLSKRLECDSRLRVVTLAWNAGSAAGFAAGLKASTNSLCSHVWILDDDNEPEPQALQSLITLAFQEKKSVFLSLRSDRPQYARFAAGDTYENCFGRMNSFLGFSLVGKIFRVLKIRESRCPAVDVNQRQLREVPYAPYGGLFLPIDALQAISLPREDFVLYEDDHEFTARLRAAGHPIFLVPTSRLVDLEDSWNLKPAGKVTPFNSQWVPLKDTNDVLRRIYYTARNRVFLERFVLNVRLIPYLINLVFLLTGVAVCALAASVIYRTTTPLVASAVLWRAVNHGWRGKLGPRTKWFGGSKVVALGMSQQASLGPIH